MSVELHLMTIRTEVNCGCGYQLLALGIVNVKGTRVSRRDHSNRGCQDLFENVV
jgi:hypothetical protein